MPASVSELAARSWDAIVVGGGHNGLTAAAYLAKAGRAVLVLERRERLGGACTLERPFESAPDYVVSPCAYVVGLLDEVVIRRARARAPRLPRHARRPEPLGPLPDGTSVAEFIDPARTAEHMRSQGFADRDIRGLEAYEDAFDRLRRALRQGSAGDTWQSESPDRAELERILDGDRELISILFEDSIADVLDRYIDDERLKHALFGQGVIGTFAGPRDPGTASIKLMHHQGDLQGLGLGLGLRRRRHGPGLVRDRPGGARGGGGRSPRASRWPRSHPGRGCAPWRASSSRRRSSSPTRIPSGRSRCWTGRRYPTPTASAWRAGRSPRRS